MTAIQIQNDHMSKILFNSSLQEGTNKMVQLVQRVNSKSRVICREQGILK